MGTENAELSAGLAIEAPEKANVPAMESERGSLGSLRDD
jgi:hypothetical protein